MSKHPYLGTKLVGFIKLEGKKMPSLSIFQYLKIYVGLTLDCQSVFYFTIVS